MCMTRRSFLCSTTATLAATTLAQLPRLRASVAAAAPITRMGIASTSFSSAGPGAAPGVQPGGNRRDTYEYLERCHALGAGGIQTQLNGDLARLRARAEELGMFVEGMVSLPRDGNVAAFEKGLQDAKTAGAVAVRAAALGGRRYETFATLEDWNQWRNQTFNTLRLAMPIIEKQKMPFALENHKDWTLEDMERLLKTYSSEYLGVCLDFGNNIALLDDPMEFAEKLTPYALSTHVKDMGVRPYEDGFLLSEVPLGQGILDLPGIVGLIQKTRPKTRFSLEMMTRDPLRVPCLTDKYWAVFPDRNGVYLARTMKLVQTRGSRDPLPQVSQLSHEERIRVEEDNIKTCLRYSREKLNL